MGRKLTKAKLDQILAGMPTRRDEVITVLSGMLTLAASEVVGLCDCGIGLIGSSP